MDDFFEAVRDLTDQVERSFGKDVWKVVHGATTEFGYPSFNLESFASLVTDEYKTTLRELIVTTKDKNAATAYAARLQWIASALGFWRISKNAYMLDCSLYEHLGTTNIDGEISTSFFRFLPQKATYICLPVPLPVGKITGDKAGTKDASIVGFMYWPHVNLSDEEYALVVAVIKNCDGDFFFEILKAVPIKDSIKVADVILNFGPLESFGVEEPTFTKNPRVLKCALIVAMYVCGANAEIHCPIPSKPRLKTSKKPYAASNTVTNYEVGYRIGAALAGYNVTTHAGVEGVGGGTGKMQPHVRRAHFHGFWTGKVGTSKRLLRVKWLPPIPVAVGDGGDVQPVLHHVLT